MKFRAVLKRLVAVAHAGEETAALERIVGSLDKQQRDRVHGRSPKGERWFALASPWLVVLADCHTVLGKEETVSDDLRLRWIPPVKGSGHVEG